MSSRFAAIDIGSNSSLLLILELGGDNIVRVVIDTKTSTRLSAGTQYGDAIGEDALRRQFSALDKFAQLLRENHVETTIACGTQVFRVASNAAKIAEEIARRYDWRFEIISGEREAQLSFKAATSGLTDVRNRRIILDVGGGSSEVVSGVADNIVWSHSFPVGAVSLTERFGLNRQITPAKLSDARAFLERIFSDLSAVLQTAVNNESAGPDDYPELVAVGGTSTTLAAISLGQKIFGPNAIHGVRMNRQSIQRQLAELGKIEAAERRELIPFDPDRAEIIVGGATIIDFLMEKLAATSLTVSNCGLRWGLILDTFPQLQRVEIAQ